MPQSNPLIITIEQAAHGQRLDRALADALPDRSRSEIQRWIKEGRVRVGGETAKASLKPAAGDTVEIDLPDAPQESPLAAERRDWPTARSRPWKLPACEGPSSSCCPGRPPAKTRAFTAA